MTDRDHFAAAALTGLLARPDVDADPLEHHFCCEDAYKWADAMLRCRAGADCPLPDNAPNLDAAPAARADLPDERPPNAVSANGGTPCAASRDGSGTGDTTEPVAWAVMLSDGERIYDVYTIAEEAKAIDEAVTGNHGIVPLYRSPTLTGAEREAIQEVIEYLQPAGQRHQNRVAATLRGLLERLK